MDSGFTSLGLTKGYVIHLAFELQPHPTTIPLVRFDNIFCAAAEMPRNGQKRHVSTNNSVTRVAQPKQKISLAHSRTGHRPAKSQLVSPAQSRTRARTKKYAVFSRNQQTFPYWEMRRLRYLSRAWAVRAETFTGAGQFNVLDGHRVSVETRNVVENGCGTRYLNGSP